jgi:hypothetical protein
MAAARTRLPSCVGWEIFMTGGAACVAHGRDAVLLDKADAAIAWTRERLGMSGLLAEAKQ